MLDKKDYIERVALKLKEWDERIDELRARAEFADVPDKTRLGHEVMELKEKRRRGSDVLRDLHEACEDEWDETRRSAEDLLKEPVQGLGKAA